MTTIEAMKVVSKILKERFSSLTVDETLDLAGKIVEALGVGENPCCRGE